MNDDLQSIPPSWCWATANDLIDAIRSGKSFKCEEHPPGAGEVGVVKVSAVTWGTYDEDESKTCTRPEMVNSDLFIHPRDFLFSRANTIDLVGACVIAERVTKPVMLSDKILRFEIQEGWDRWLLWLLRSGHGRSEIQSLATGNQNSMRNIGQARIRQIRVPVPPLPEQHRIVEAVESYLTRLDAAVVTLERVKVNLKRYRASVLKAAVEGRLVPTEAELAQAEGRDYEPASVLLERILEERRRRWTESGKRGKYKEPVTVAADTEGLPELPLGWCWATVDQITGEGGRGLCDGPFGSNLKTAHYTSSGPRVVRLQNIGDGSFRDERAHIAQDHFNHLSKHEVIAGDLIIASLGEILPRSCIVPGWLGPAIVKADCIRFRTNPYTHRVYLCHALNSQPVRRRTTEKIHGVGRPRLGLKGIREIVLPLPPTAEQERIAANVEHQISVVDVSEQVVDLQLARCFRLRQSILKWAFEGKLADQDPDDEPASVLLERIRAERDATMPKKATHRGRPRRRV